MPKTVFSVFDLATRTVKVRIFWMWSLIIMANVLAHSIPYFLKQILEIATVTEVGHFWTALQTTLIVLLLVLVFREVLTRIAHVMETNICLKAQSNVALFLYQKLIMRPSAYFEDRLTGDVNRKIDQIVRSTVFFLEMFPWRAGSTLTSFPVFFTLLALSHWYLALTFFLWTCSFVLTSYPLLKHLYRWDQKLAESDAMVAGEAIDMLGNINIVHSFAREKSEYNRFTDRFASFLAIDKEERLALVWNKLQQGSHIALLGISLVGVSVYLLNNSLMQVADLVIIAGVIPVMSNVVWNIGDVSLESIRKFGTISSALESLQTDVEQLSAGRASFTSGKFDIVFKGITFQYPGTAEKVFDDFSLSVTEGTRVGIVGSSGAGKSTLIKLLLRQQDFSTGSILLGGTDIQTVSVEALRTTIALVPQDTTLFHRSLYENITYAKPDATHEEVLAASKGAHAHDFIEKLPRQYETIVGERGMKLSGGQRQRIAIARAMLKDAPILVLDEATSALDSETEEIIQIGFHELFAERTVVAIAHRLSTLREMDRIVVIEEGKIVEDGTPQALLQKQDGVFKKKWDQQKSGFIS